MHADLALLHSGGSVKRRYQFERQFPVGETRERVDRGAYHQLDPTDEYQFAIRKSAQPNGITTDTHGNIYVGGCAKDASGIDHWIVRKLPAQ